MRRSNQRTLAAGGYLPNQSYSAEGTSLSELATELKGLREDFRNSPVKQTMVSIDRIDSAYSERNRADRLSR
ncbi:MAG: hypothetical protein GWP27_06005 [Bacteroidetes bacterium]|nr:hypothetical protein [Flavobacteriales bacterium]MBT6132985.1 hypothetical protein [Flavobacteriales bacterium]NCG30007.1 hypothetical protein [Bacteroidota bacterium]